MAPSAIKQEVHMDEPVAVLTAADDQAEDELLGTDELLVEEVSIDGMCGVY
jgi:mycofactocin precursor